MRDERGLDERRLDQFSHSANSNFEKALLNEIAVCPSH
jgi:hypothetical protein